MDPIEWCRQRLLVRGHSLTASLPFAAPELRDRILSLRAVIAEITAIADNVTEPDIAGSKLQWWKQALARELPHPAVQALSATGARAAVRHARFETLIDGVSAILSDPRFENRGQAWAHCMAIGGPAAALEADLVGAGPELGERLATLGSTAWLVRLVRDLAGDARNHRWLVPLDIQAEFQMSRADVAAGKSSPAFNGLIRTWLSDGFRHSNQALAGIDAHDAWRHRHLLIQHALDRRLAAMLERKPARILRERVLPGQLGNAWCAWRAARRLAGKARS